MATSGQSNQSNGMELSPVEGRDSKPLALGGNDDAYDQVQVVITDGSYDCDQDDTISFTLNGEGASFCSNGLRQISVKVETVKSDLGVWGVQQSAPKFQSTSATQVTVKAEMTSRNGGLPYTGSYAFTFTQAAAASFPVASTSIPGIVQLASRAEVTTGADASKAVTPSDIHAVYAPLDNPKFTGSGQLVNGDAPPRMLLAMAMVRSNTAKQTLDSQSVYMQIGGSEYAQGSYRLIGFGYTNSTDAQNPPVAIGSVETYPTGNETVADFIVATRPDNTGAAPIERFRVHSTGSVTITKDQTRLDDFVDDQELVTAKWVRSQTPTIRRCLPMYFIKENVHGPKGLGFYAIPANSGDIIAVLTEDNPIPARGLPHELIEIQLANRLELGNYIFMTNRTEYVISLKNGPNGSTNQSDSMLLPGETKMFVVFSDMENDSLETTTILGYKIG